MNQIQVKEYTTIWCGSIAVEGVQDLVESGVYIVNKMNQFAETRATYEYSGGRKGREHDIRWEYDLHSHLSTCG